MQAFAAPGFSRQRGEQLTKELMYEVMARASAVAQLDKLWADTFLTNAGINSGSSTGYTYRGSADYDVILRAAGVQDSQTLTGSTQAAEIGSNIAATERGAGVVYLASSSYTLNSVKFRLQRLGSPTGNLIVNVYNGDAGGVPTGAAIASSAAFSRATLSSSWTDVEITLTSGVALTSGNKYIIMLEASGAYTGDASNHIKMAGTGGNTNAARSQCRKSNADSYTNSAGDDIQFEAIQAAASSAVVKSVNITMPSAITSVLLHANVTGGPADLYRVSTDGGSTWTTIAAANVATSTSDGNVVSVPSGTSVIIEITLSGSMELESWGIAGA